MSKQEAPKASEAGSVLNQGGASREETVEERAAKLLPKLRKELASAKERLADFEAEPIDLKDYNSMILKQERERLERQVADCQKKLDDNEEALKAWRTVQAQRMK
jgi:vacuolar-type H+-ATPase subunit I/STV1